MLGMIHASRVRRPGSTRASAGAPALDQQAFADFYHRTAAGLWRYLRRFGDAALADDLLQESYLKFLRQPGRSSDERAQRAYLYRIATNLARDRVRRRQREEQFQGQLLAATPAASGPRNRSALRIDVGTVLGTLKPRQRALLWLAYVEGYEHRQIARILGLQAGSIRVLLYRARRRFSQALAEHGLGEEVLGEEVTP